MKKIVSTVLATAMMFGMSAMAFAAPVYETDSQLKNTVIGFSGALKDYNVDITQIEGTVQIPFQLGENASYYNVEVEVNEGGKQLGAEYNKSKNAIVIRPNVPVNQTEAEPFEIEIEVQDRKSRDVIAEGYTITGEVSYDAVQIVEDEGRYNNSRGVIYDFSSGAEKVRIYAGSEVTVNVAKPTKGIVNLHLSTDGIDALDDKFFDNNLKVYQFVANPKFTGGVEVTIDAGSDSFIYEYAGGELRKVEDVSFDENNGYTIKTKQLTTYVVSDEELEVGMIDESAGSESGSGGQAPESDKNNPTTGASDTMGAVAALAALSLAGIGFAVAKRSRK